MFNYALLFVNVVLLVAGQTLWKLGLTNKGALNSIGGIVTAMLSPWVIAGILLYVIATGISIFLISRMPLSLLYPLQSLTYVGVVIVASLVFHEHVTLWRWLGVGIILIGVGFVVK